MALSPPQRLLTEREIAEIREGLRIGLRGPVLTNWCEQLLKDRDERMRLEAARAR